MAGVPRTKISEALPSARHIARAMPNLPSKIGRGITAYVLEDSTPDSLKVHLDTILSCFGTCIKMQDDCGIDKATAVSGSGPAYVFRFLDAFVEAAKELGLSEADASLLVSETVAGSLHLAKDQFKQLSALASSVSSKGGTTEAAFRVFDSARFNDIIKEAVKSAYARARELSK